MEAALGLAALGLDEEYAVDGLVAVHCHGGGVPEDGHALDLLNRDAVDGAFHSVDEDEDARLAGGLYATDVEGGSPALFTLETGVLEGGQAKEFAIQGVGKADGRGTSELLGCDGICRRSGEVLRTLDAVAQIHLL